MTISKDDKIKFFFEGDIIDLDDGKIDEFLDEFSCDIVLQSLSEKLKIIAKSKYPDEVAWRLGRTFGDISKRYSADVKAYFWLEFYNSSEKKSLLNFLSGYWDQTKPDFDTLKELSNTLADEIFNKEWPKELIRAGIDAVTNGYSSLEYRSEVSFEIKSAFEGQLKLFETYLSDTLYNASDSCQTLDFVKSVLSK